MSEELSNALAELAQKLGVSVDQLWEYVSGPGISEYATVQIVNYAFGAVGSILAFCALIALIEKGIDWTKGEDEYMHELGFIISGIALIPAFFCVWFNLDCMAGLLKWVITPRGAVIEMLLKHL